MTVRVNFFFDSLAVKWNENRNGMEKGQAPKKRDNIKTKAKKEKKTERAGGKWNVRVDVLRHGESTDLIFSMVSSGMGATVCTAGRFLLVAPLTKEEEEEEEEEAESAAPWQHTENKQQAEWREQW